MTQAGAAPGCPVHDDFDPFSPEYHADPYAVLGPAAARSADRCSMRPCSTTMSSPVTRRSSRSSSTPRRTRRRMRSCRWSRSSRKRQQILLEGGHSPQPSMVSLDEPAHRRLRKPTVRAFTPRRVAAMEPRIRAMVTELLDAVDASTPFDLVAALTFPLPATMIFSFMGVPRADWPMLKEWCGHRAGLAWGRPTPDEQVQHAENMAAYRATCADSSQEGRRPRRRLHGRVARDPRRGPGGADP